MKLINKWITRLFWGGFDLRYGLKGFMPIPKTYLYTTPTLAVIGYQAAVNNKFPWEAGVFTHISVALFLFTMYIIFVHWVIWPVQFKDCSKYQKWLFGNGVLKNNVGLKAKLTDEEVLEWIDLDVEARDN